MTTRVWNPNDCPQGKNQETWLWSWTFLWTKFDADGFWWGKNDCISRNLDLWIFSLDTQKGSFYHFERWTVLSMQWINIFRVFLAWNISSLSARSMAQRRYGQKVWQEAWVECVGLGSQIDHRTMSNNMRNSSFLRWSLRLAKCLGYSFKTVSPWKLQTNLFCFFGGGIIIPKLIHLVKKLPAVDFVSENYIWRICGINATKTFLFCEPLGCAISVTNMETWPGASACWWSLRFF